VGLDSTRGDLGAQGSYQRLLLPWRSVEVQSRLEERLRRPVVLAVTANRTSLVRVLPETGRTRVRLHAMFLYAPLEVLDALARYARRPHDLEANEVLDAFIHGESRRLTPLGSPTVETGQARGERYDLEEIFEDVNRRFFDGRVTAKIAWSRGTVERRRRSILFGSYLREPGETVGSIRIHPALDAEWVPRGFVEFVVHHEILHAVIPARAVRGRRLFHPPEFRRRERAYPEYARWRLWEKENLARFLGKLPPPAPSREAVPADEGEEEEWEWFAEL
jgi:hypothetical protein